ncbi:hypothetical protein ACJRO7_018111 [Eucalyptus globulus]|uniref:PGG domain-containing protein n=1 Tax=Eucalyptus globulus TaxID=34317 RepID=A0ABD3KTR8_EUCGL
MSDFQGGVIEKIKKMLDKQFVEGQPGASIITGSNIANRENSDSSTRNLINLQQLMATLIATVTFAATFTMPGGYNNDGPNRGMAILADRAAFKAFFVALFIQFDTCFPGPRHELRYTHLVARCIFIAIWAMVLAFACGTYAVLTGIIRLGISPFIIGGCIVIMYSIGCSLDPHNKLNRLRHYPGRYVRNLLYKYKIL